MKLPMVGIECYKIYLGFMVGMPELVIRCRAVKDQPF